MPVSAAVLRDHIEYSSWASNRLLDAAAQLTPEEQNRDFQTADRSLLGTMYHVIGADILWLARLEGAAPTGFPDRKDGSLANLRTDFAANRQGWQDWAAKLTDTSPGTELTYRDMKGDEYRMPIWQIVFHRVNHGTHHRGQAAGFLRAMDHKPPVLDFLYYQRQKS